VKSPARPEVLFSLTKVKILRSLRKEFPTGDLPIIAADQDDDADVENLSKILRIDIPSEALVIEEAQ
jgi:hypothetical protein